jgi:hypothetical protein
MSPARAITLKNGEHVQTVVLKPGSDFESEGLKLTKWVGLGSAVSRYTNSRTTSAGAYLTLQVDRTNIFPTMAAH